MIGQFGMRLYCLVFAQADSFQNMTGHFRGQRSRPTSYDLIWVVAIAVTVILGAWLLSRVLARQERERPYNSRRAMFRALCRAHGLDRAARRLLKRLAGLRRVADPAQLFVEPQHFDVGSLPAPLAPQKRRIESLARRLFGNFAG